MPRVGRYLGADALLEALRFEVRPPRATRRVQPVRGCPSAGDPSRLRRDRRSGGCTLPQVQLSLAKSSYKTVNTVLTFACDVQLRGAETGFQVRLSPAQVRPSPASRASPRRPVEEIVALFAARFGSWGSETSTDRPGRRVRGGGSPVPGTKVAIPFSTALKPHGPVVPFRVRRRGRVGIDRAERGSVSDRHPDGPRPRSGLGSPKATRARAEGDAIPRRGTGAPGRAAMPVPGKRRGRFDLTPQSDARTAPLFPATAVSAPRPLEPLITPVGDTRTGVSSLCSPGMRATNSSVNAPSWVI